MIKLKITLLTFTLYTNLFLIKEAICIKNKYENQNVTNMASLIKKQNEAILFKQKHD